MRKHEQDGGQQQGEKGAQQRVVEEAGGESPEQEGGESERVDDDAVPMPAGRRNRQEHGVAGHVGGEYAAELEIAETVDIAGDRAE